jgi:F-type H+-transporting ATPase subunit b
MLIDWFTVIAQAINFLILVWLLKRFLYKPILKAIDQREEKVKNRLSQAEAKMEKAEEEQESYRQKHEELEKKRSSLLDEADREAREKRKQQLEAARQESEDLRTRLKESIREDYENLKKDIKKRLQAEVFAVAKEMLDDLASTSLEAQITEVFIRRLQDLDPDQKQELAEMLAESPDKILIKSAFELPDEQRKKIESAVRELEDQEFNFRYEVDPERISGLELSAEGYKMAWSIAEYLRSLEQQLAELIDEEEQKEQKERGE